MASISAKVGLSPAALLRHAASKKELFFAAMSPARGKGERSPLDFLSSVRVTADPAKVLRRLAKDLITYGEQALRTDLVRSLHQERSGGFRLLVDHIKRAAAAHRLDVEDPEATALALLGGAQSYLLLQHILRIFDPPLPLDRYLDTLVRVWTNGILPKSKRTR